MLHSSPNISYEKSLGDYFLRCTINSHNPAISIFVAKIYYYRAGFSFNEAYTQLLKTLLEEDEKLSLHTTTFTIYDVNGEIAGTIRKIEKTNMIRLPIEREFTTDFAASLIDSLPINQVFEVARFATKRVNLNVSKALIREVLSTSNSNDLLFVSMDAKVLKRISTRGLPFIPVGHPKDYLGSVTIPALLRVRDTSGEFNYRNLH